MTLTANPYLEGNYAPVLEEVTETELAVIGQLPDSLDGRYLRNGPNPVTPPDPASYHWFTGDGMVHAIELEGGKAVSYRNRWVRTRKLAAELGIRHILVPPNPGILCAEGLLSSTLTQSFVRTIQEPLGPPATMD